MKARPFDEIRVKVGMDEDWYLYVDYDDNGHHVTWPSCSAAEKYELMIVLLKLLQPVLPASMRVKMLSTEAWCTKMLEESKGDAPIKDEPPF